MALLRLYSALLALIAQFGYMATVDKTTAANVNNLQLLGGHLLL